MSIVRNPLDRPPPESYHQGVEVFGTVRTLYVAGQIGVEPDGTVFPGIEAQSRAVYANMKAVLNAAGMTFADIVKTTVFLVNPEDRSAFTKVRAEVTDNAKNASTLVYVAGLVSRDLLVEVEAVAVRQVEPDLMPEQ